MGVLLLRSAGTNPLGPWEAVPAQLMAEQCSLRRVDQTHNTPYQSQFTRIVERGTRVLENALRALLLDRGQGGLGPDATPTTACLSGYPACRYQ